MNDGPTVGSRPPPPPASIPPPSYAVASGEEPLPDGDGQGELITAWTPRSVLFAITFFIALVEILGHAAVQSRVPPERDWDRVATRLRDALREPDGIVVAPEWAEPVAYRALGELMTATRAGYSDLAPFERVFEISARGRRHPALRGVSVASTERVGTLTLRSYELGPTPVLYDLVSALPEAQVEVRPHDGGAPTRCTYRDTGRHGRGGLGAGPMMPSSRFVCDGQPPWVYVGETITEDLDLQPRRCVWQHPPTGGTLSTTFDDVPLGDHLVLYAGLYYEHERMLENPPFDLRVLLDGREVGAMVHRDGDGWKRIEVATGHAERGRIRIEVSADTPHLRSVCWAAETRRHRRALPLGDAP